MNSFSVKSSAGVLLALVAGIASAASSPDGVWRDVSEASIATRGERLTRPARYRTVHLDVASIASRLAQAPSRKSGAPGLDLMLPRPDGKFETFRIVEVSIMEDELAAKFPDIKTYAGQGVDDPLAWVRLDLTPLGFHAMVRGAAGTYYIDPYQLDKGASAGPEYFSYFKADYPRSDRHAFQCGVHENLDKAPAQPGANRTPVGSNLHTYTLAVATTGEYTGFHGGTVAAGQAAVVTAINRVVGIYEAEFAISMTLIGNNDQLIFTNPATDPYSNFDGFTMLGQNQATIDSIIGSGAYDIGHVLSTGGGGIAGLGVVCAGNNKARGVTGLPSPIGDPFYIDYVSHEIGHQMGSNHTFNGTAGSCGGGNRNGSTAYEPGSGSTIMAYSGICSSHNIQNDADPYFHTSSFDEIVSYTRFGFGSVCDSVTATGNAAPLVEAGNGFTVPVGTPLRLSGSATDPNSDPLVYRWEQFDLGPGGSPNAPSGNAPIFRSFEAVSIPIRLLPKLSNILNDSQTIGELLPTYTRNLRFRLTALDNQANGGGVDYDTVLHSVTDTSGPFEVTSQNSGATWEPGTSQNISWDVANTTAAPVSCANVNILLSLDGGNNFDEFIALFTPNDGSHSFIVPLLPTTTARVSVECADNIFFDINNSNITITDEVVPNFTLDSTTANLDVCAPANGTLTVDVDSIGGFTGPVTMSASGNPTGTTTSFSPNPVNAGGSTLFTLGNTGAATAGSYSLNLAGVGTPGNDSVNVSLDLVEGPAGAANLSAPADGAIDESTTPTLIWNPVADADSYTVEIATDAGFGNIVYSAAESGTSHVVGNALSGSTEFYWRVQANNLCGGTPSAASTFTTVQAPINLCGGAGLAIPDNDTQGVSDTLNITDSGTILDVNVSIDATHSYVGNTIFTLTSVSTGTEVTLIDRPFHPFFPGGCPENDIDVVLDDEGTTAAEDACEAAAPAVGGTLTPNEALSAFDGQSVTGDWTLNSSDVVSGDSGTLNQWCVEITIATGAPDTDEDGVTDDADNCIDVPNPDQRDTNSDGFGNICDPDLNNDGVVNPVDLGLFRTAFFSTGPGIDADFNGDEVVNPVDLGILRSFFFLPPGPSGIAP